MDENDPRIQAVDNARRRETRRQLPGLIISISLMILGVGAIIWMVLFSKTPPG